LGEEEEDPGGEGDGAHDTAEGLVGGEGGGAVCRILVEVLLEDVCWVLHGWYPSAVSRRCCRGAEDCLEEERREENESYLRYSLKTREMSRQDLPRQERQIHN
jgi:hypothetical protein